MMKPMLFSSVLSLNNNVFSETAAEMMEKREIYSYYAFYDPEYERDVREKVGQYWSTPTGLDYKPTVEIRNHVKKLIDKQQRFMFGVSPDVVVQPSNKETIDSAEDLKQLIDKVMKESEFWNETFKAFLDATIGKRVLLVVDANPGLPINFKYFAADQFTYKYDTHDTKKLTNVVIAYQEENDNSDIMAEQRWYRWEYYLGEDENGEEVCYLDYGLYNGNGEPIPEKTTVGFNTGFSEIPARVILNNGRLGDIEGSSDVKDLMDIQNSYNRRMSDLSDALRFGMFEQPVVKNALPESVAAIRVAPNALIDLKPDPSARGLDTDVFMLSKQFTFQEAAEYYLNQAIKDMYEIMDQPRPEDIKNAPSAKALRYTFYDLMARCEEKWREWEPAIEWAINLFLEANQRFDLYPGHSGSDVDYEEMIISLSHNYPIPDDEEERKRTALNEVSANARSIRSYIREHGFARDEDVELQEIIEEQKLLNSLNMDSFTTLLDETDPEEEV